MTEQEVASYKEQMFGQSNAQSPTPDSVPPADTPPVDAPVTDIPPVDTPLVETPVVEVADSNAYLKENLGYESWDAAKAELAELRQLKETARKPIEYVNEESKKVHELLLAGKVKEVKAIYDLQEKLETAESLTPAEAIKLHIEQTNRHFKKADVEDVFEEKYALPEKPEEDDDDYEAKLAKYNITVDKITRKIERDAVTAKEELAKLKTEIKLPEIPQAENPEMEAFNQYNANMAKAAEHRVIVMDTLSKLTEKDISYDLNFSDEAKKIQFPISYKSDKAGVEKAKHAAANYTDFLTQNYFKEDGSPLADKLTADIYFLQNRDKIMTEAINQAVNETMLHQVKIQKGYGDGIQRNFSVAPPDELAKLKQAVFG